YAERTTKRRTRRYHSRLFAFELLIAYTAQNTKIALLSGCKTIRAVYAIIVRGNFLFNRCEHSHGADANIRLDAPRLAILSRTSEIIGQVELGRNFWNPIALRFVDFRLVGTAGNRIDTACRSADQRAANILQLALRGDKSARRVDSVTLFKENIEILRASLETARIGSNRAPEESRDHSRYFNALYTHKCPPTQQRY